MDIKDVESLRWSIVPSDIWNKIKGTETKYYCKIVKEDMDLFINNLIKEYSKSLNVDIDDFKDLFMQKNKAFYHNFTFYFVINPFETTKAFEKNSSTMKYLSKLLLVPDTTDYVEKLYNEFMELTNSEKDEFLKRIESIKSKL